MVEGSDSYIRGGGGVAVDGRRVGRWVLDGSAVLLAAVLILLSVDLVRAASRAERLRTTGVPVTFTVTGCRGLASGTGITEAGYACRGTFTLGGRSYEQTLHASTALHPVGSAIAAVVVPGEPASVSAAGSPASRGPGAKDFGGPIIVLVAFLLVLAARFRLRRRAVT